MNWYVTFAALIFWFMENRYFGWNMMPKSEAELICDGLVLLMFCIGVTKP